MKWFAKKQPSTLETLSLKYQLQQGQTINRAIVQPTYTSDDSDRAPSFECMIGDRGYSETASVVFSGDTPPSYTDMARGNASHTDESISSVDWNFPQVTFEDITLSALSFDEIYPEHDLWGFGHLEDERDVFAATDLFNIFEDIPRLDELEEAFDVFDGNKDGFIDAWELQRALFALEMNEKADIEDCKKMIRVFDNTDGMIDFNEFVKLMETTWS